MREVTISLTSLLICACASSPPFRFFVLDPIAPAGDVAEAAGNPVQIASVRVPPMLDRREIVREEAPNKLTISHQNRWGAPLPDMTQRVLSQNLMLRLPAGRVVLPEQPAPAGTSSISVDILQFGVDASGTVVLEGSWSLVPSGTDLAAANHRFHLNQRAVAGDYADQARAMSTLLGQLADSIIHELHTWDAG
jgi:uncharacterized lipoprotein YmbA